MQRIMGTEVEYGISSPQDRTTNPIVTSTQAVLAYAAAAGVPRAKRTRWDYEVESPLRDARGFEMARELAHRSQLTDVEDPTIAASVLSNGARFYVDHAHPEYSSPEVTSPLEAVRYDRAGELVARAAVEALAAQGRQVRLYKNNVDGKGASYGTHENYLMRRSTPFNDIVTHLTPFFVSRQVVAGAGRVGIGQDGRLLPSG